MAEPSINPLIAEYEAWNKAQGLNLGSADEHLFDEALTDGQRRWLADFCERWEEAERADREARRQEAIAEFRALVGRYGIQWDANVPREAYERMNAVGKVLTERDRREALGLPIR